jgi:hypothetical protein
MAQRQLELRQSLIRNAVSQWGTLAAGSEPWPRSRGAPPEQSKQ